jgi:hypothetical protein
MLGARSPQCPPANPAPKNPQASYNPWASRRFIVLLLVGPVIIREDAVGGERTFEHNAAAPHPTQLIYRSIVYNSIHPKTFEVLSGTVCNFHSSSTSLLAIGAVPRLPLRVRQITVTDR